jgi:hypothetical protein
MIRKVLSVALLVTAVGCSKGGSGEVKELSNGYCRTFFREVSEASAKYEQFAAAIAAGKLDAEQRKRAESELPYGAARQERGLMSLELLKRMSF